VSGFDQYNPLQVGVDAARFASAGYELLPAPFAPGTLDALRAETRLAIRETFGDSPFNGRWWLSGLSSACQLGSRLAIEEGQLWDSAERLLGRSVVPCPPEIGRLAVSTPMHYDDPIGIVGVKFVFYLDAQPGAAGLRILGGSHAGQHQMVCELFASLGKEQATAKVAGALTQLTADRSLVAAIDLHVWHDFPGSGDRVLWCPEFVAMPETDGEVDLVRRKFAAVAEHDTPELVSGADTIWRDWLSSPGNWRKLLAIERLAACGAFEDGQDLR
jgi:hypothetical protein